MSGVYIPGMEMPKEGTVVAIYKRGNEFYIVQGVDRCPLIPVPDHGRLIDADAFEKDQCNSCDGWCDCVECDCLNCNQEVRCNIILELHNAPTVIPADKEEDT